MYDKFDLPNKRDFDFDHYIYTGGDGSSEKNAIIINLESSVVGIPAEYDYLRIKYGLQDTDWGLYLQRCVHNGEKTFDILDIKLKDGTLKKYYFDISNFYGKW